MAGSTPQQVADDLRAAGVEAAAGAVRVVVTHHPYGHAGGGCAAQAGGARSDTAMAEFAKPAMWTCFLSGHLHSAQAILTSGRYKLPGYSAIVAHAGTAVSTRTRGEANEWNLIRVDGGTIGVQRVEWDGKRFRRAELTEYRRGDAGWAAV